MSTKTKRKRQKCRPGSSSEVYLMPVFNSPPDMKKLARAFIAIASQTKDKENESLGGGRSKKAA
jgi:hypothetical protein